MRSIHPKKARLSPYNGSSVHTTKKKPVLHEIAEPVSIQQPSQVIAAVSCSGKICNRFLESFFVQADHFMLLEIRTFVFYME